MWIRVVEDLPKAQNNGMSDAVQIYTDEYELQSVAHYDWNINCWKTQFEDREYPAKVTHWQYLQRNPFD